jgi:predicted metallo-beta-lactamase superfamily hydrolase
VFHGLSDRLGYVIEILIEDNEKFLYTSDVLGPLHDEAVQFMVDKKPDKIIIDGPATYLLGSHYKKCDIELAIENIKRVITETPVKTLIIDHHLLRDLKWAEYIDELHTTKSDLTVCSAAGYLGKKEDILEARRRELYQSSIRE